MWDDITEIVKFKCTASTIATARIDYKADRLDIKQTIGNLSETTVYEFPSFIRPIKYVFLPILLIHIGATKQLIINSGVVNIAKQLVLTDDKAVQKVASSLLNQVKDS